MGTLPSWGSASAHSLTLQNPEGKTGYLEWELRLGQVSWAKSDALILAHWPKTRGEEGKQKQA